MRAVPLTRVRERTFQRPSQADLLGQQRHHRGPRTRRQALAVRDNSYRESV
jgi:hypothetical protein